MVNARKAATRETRESVKLSAAMREALFAILAHEDAGRIGAPTCSIPPRTRTALHRRGLIAPTVDGSRKLTPEGRKAIAAPEVQP